ncbi:Tudor domain-containing protein 1 [Eufriesea mexicana]|uniref:Tudor domain-containing protein 1 n=1 Tax=Eufriesea mexicana TaxID=516756 RepID=A0A310SJ93_9HYME|nr:Tudor domain-containing protein 1 [Eufriesea mexicana]
MACYDANEMTENKSSNSNEFKLYVSNLPEELNEHGLLQIFNHYGQVKGYFYRSNANWAYITYDTYLKAENARKDLDDVPPLHLKVSYAKKRDSNKGQSTKVSTFKDVTKCDNHDTIVNTLTDKQLIQTRGRGNPLDVFKKMKPNPGLPRYTYTADNDLLYPYPSDPYTYNPYENLEPYASTNALWTRGQLTITQDGKRHVSFGRGYTFYEIPDANPEVHNYINNVYEKRTLGLYEYGEDQLQNTDGICKTCLKRAKYSCERCNTLYCSRDCQVTDWPQHKVECKDMPGLVTVMCSMPESKTNKSFTRNVPDIQIPLRRPKKLIQDIMSSNEVLDSPTKNKNMNHIFSLKGLAKKETSNKDTQNPEEINSQENVKNHKKFNINVEQIENDISFSNQTFLSETKFTDVMIIVKENREFWVQKVKDLDDIAQLMNKLQLEAAKAQKVEPIIGNIYALQYENVWHRAIPVCLNPMKVHYIDYGNDDIIQINDFREIDKYKYIPKFCAKIRLSQQAYEKYKNIKYEDVISVKMISIDSNKVINVEVQNEDNISMPETIQTNGKPIQNIPSNLKIDNKSPISSETSIKDEAVSSSDKRSIVNDISNGEIGVLEIHAEIKNNTYSVTLQPNSKVSDYKILLTTLPKICAQVAECSNHRPDVGDFVCGRELDGGWHRGYILSLKPSLKMAVIDTARVAPINKTVTCPEIFCNICAFGAVCEVTSSNIKFNEGDQYEFKVLSRSHTNEQNKIIEISQQKNKIHATVKPWNPMPEQKGLELASLKTGSEVYITSYQNHTRLFVRSSDTAEVEYYNYILQNVAKCAQTSSFLKEPPVIGEMVIAQYTDKNYYRAIVTQVQDDKITVSYIDFGNIEVTDIKKLKILSDNLKQLRCCITKVILKDVPKDVPMTEEVSIYLSMLVGCDTPLLCTFDGSPCEDGVYLKLHNGESVNKVISDLLVPTSKEIAEKSKTCYMVNDLNTVDLGNVGDTIDAIVLHVIDNGRTYAMCPIDYDLITHVYDIMSKQMTEYCEANNYYIPRDNELCLAFYKEGWYRAVCVQYNYKSTISAVFFVDYGNTEFVEHKNIRLMPKDFMSPHAVASICNIINVAPINSSGQYSPEIEKRLSELVVSDIHVKIKIVGNDSEMYNVELPLIRAQLIEEGLIST